MKIYIVRHADAISGQELSDRDKNLLGLTRYGKLEALAAAKALKNEGITKVVASPLERARETAILISNILHTPILYDERLREFSPDLDSKDPILLSKLKKEARINPDMEMQGGETLNEAVGRLSRVLDDLAVIGSNACVVSHRVIIEAFLDKWFGLKVGESEWLSNASITVIEFKEDNPQLIFYNRRYRDWKLLVATFLRKIGLYI